MKKIVYLITFITLTTLTTNCDNKETDINLEQNEKLDISQMHDDPLFLEFLSYKTINVNKKALREKPEIHTVDDLTKLFNFKNNQETIEYFKNKNLIYRKLNSKYDIDKLTNEEFTEKLLNEDNIQYRQSCQGACDRTMRNKSIIASAVVVGAHVGCGGADLTIIGGIICHGAAHAGYMAALDEIDNQWGQCSAKC